MHHSSSTSNSRFFIKLVTILLIGLIIDRLIGYVVINAFNKNSNNNVCIAERIKRAKKYQPDILILGPSRAHHHYNAEIIEDSLGVKCYNIGSGGSNTIIHEIILDVLTQEFTPKCVVLDVFYKLSIVDENDHYRSIAGIYPFVDESESFQSEIKKISPFEQYLINLKFYKYRSIMYSVLKSIPLPKYDATIKGYWPLEIKKNPLLEKEKGDFDLENYDKDLTDKIMAIQKICDEKGIKLVVSVSPFYAEQNRQCPQILLDFFAENNIPVLNYDINKYKVFDDKSLYNDPMHLHKKGADMFTRLFVGDLKSILK